MISKKNRADKKTVEKIFKEGRFINSPNLTFKYVLTNNSVVPHISFIAPKSISRKAVERNTLRRVGYDVLKKYIHQFPLGLVGVFLFRKYQNNILIIEDEIKNTLYKIN